LFRIAGRTHHRYRIADCVLPGFINFHKLAFLALSERICSPPNAKRRVCNRQRPCLNAGNRHLLTQKGLYHVDETFTGKAFE
ncbi:hypothetical protein OFB72_29190, partial [Escherichia coli]|nr:hypothetical protein [Escherichia coli]